MMRDVQTLRKLDLLHTTITLHTVFGASDDTRERLSRADAFAIPRGERFALEQATPDLLWLEVTS